MKNLFFLSLLLIPFLGYSQHGSLRGVMRDNASGRPVIQGEVSLAISDGSVISVIKTDVNGVFTFPSILPGKYNLKFYSMKHNEVTLTGVIVLSEKITYQSVNMDLVSPIIEWQD